MRIRLTTRLGTSPHPSSLTTATDNSVQFDYRSVPLSPATVPVTELLVGSAAVLTSGGLQHRTVSRGQLRRWAPNPCTAGGAA